MWSRTYAVLNNGLLNFVKILSENVNIARISPASVSNPSDNLKNLFEIATLFYALCLYLYVIRQVDHVYVDEFG
jgi:hypothetical protein